MENRYGWLIYNGRLLSAKFDEINFQYQMAAEKKGITLDIIKNNEIFSIVQNNSLRIGTAYPNPDFILFLDKDIRLAKQLALMGYRLFNTAEAIEICDNKAMTFQALANHDIRMPKSVFSPLMFEGTQETDDSFVNFVEMELDYPIVIKEAFGSFGAQVYLVENREELKNKRRELLYIPHLYQEFIKPSRGKDVRLHVVGDRVVAAVLRISETDFRANVSNGGKMWKYQPSEEFTELAIKASRLVGADFSGVDILFGEEDEPVVCEVNSNAHIKNIYDCTGINVADHIFDYILGKIYNEKGNFDLLQRRL